MRQTNKKFKIKKKKKSYAISRLKCCLVLFQVYQIGMHIKSDSDLSLLCENTSFILTFNRIALEILEMEKLC